jgi:hypothetical protein
MKKKNFIMVKFRFSKKKKIIKFIFLPFNNNNNIRILFFILSQFIVSKPYNFVIFIAKIYEISLITSEMHTMFFLC